MAETVKKIGGLLILVALGAWLGSLLYGEPEPLRNILRTRLADATIGDIGALVVFAIILAK